MADYLPILPSQNSSEKPEEGISTAVGKTGATEPGNNFIPNYPPFSLWTAEHVPQALARFQQPRQQGTPLGLYLHIPFCRRHCKFCFYRVYTDKNALEIEAYLDALATEVEIYSTLPAWQPGGFEFVYFGGGTPSYLSSRQLTSLVKRLHRFVGWDDAEEVTFECEPGTLKREKLETLKSIGVTRLSLGVENFDDEILEENGRAHLSPEIFRAYEWARAVGFPQINIDLIAGMLGETWDRWRDTVRKSVGLEPDSVTIYQMELPFNTLYSKQIREGGKPVPVSDWETKREWMGYAFSEFERAGYVVSSAYTLVRDPQQTRFIYRDSLWNGADMIGTGVASFGHLDGVHSQNADGMENYMELLARKELPLARALTAKPRERLIRQLILLLKLGHLDVDRFRKKFDTDILSEFKAPFEKLRDRGYLTMEENGVRLTREGLMRADGLLPEFFEPDHRNIRFT